MSTNPLNELAALGQSIWYDNIQRSLLENGGLVKLIAEDSITGLTSNPSIFDNAISNSSDYDDDIAKILRHNGQIDTVTLYETLAIQDIQAAADLMQPIYKSTNGADGYISLEVSPKLANDTEATITEAARLFKAVDRPNLMIKIPGTQAGLLAITETIGSGINVNVTLMFSLKHYDDVSAAYLAGLEKLRESGGDLSNVASVASFFVSRVDTIFDNALEVIGTEEALSLRGKMGIANAKVAYHRFESVFGSDRFEALKAEGARTQRPLWASTSTKNPNYSDVLYIEELIGPDTVNTMPPSTIAAFKDHGQAESRLVQDVDEAFILMEKIKTLGIDYVELTETLQRDGVAAFANSFDSLLQSLEVKRDQVAVVS